jgi:hypothetical protein
MRKVSFFLKNVDAGAQRFYGIVDARLDKNLQNELFLRLFRLHFAHN